MHSISGDFKTGIPLETLISEGTIGDISTICGCDSVMTIVETEGCGKSRGLFVDGTGEILISSRI